MVLKDLLPSRWYREKGNEHFLKITNNALLLEDDIGQAGLATSYYAIALDAASTAEDRCKASKNLSASKTKAASLKIKKVGLRNIGYADEAKLKEWISEGLDHCRQAYHIGREASMPQQWLQEIKTKERGSFALLVELYTREAIPHSRRIIKLRQLLTAVDNVDPVLFCETHVLIAREYFKEALGFLESKHYQKARYAFEECRRPLEEAIAYARRQRRLEDIAVELIEIDLDLSKLSDDINLHSLLSHAYHFVDLGKENLRMALEEHESLETDLVYNALDDFRQARILTKDTALAPELEAEVYSRIA